MNFRERPRAIGVPVRLTRPPPCATADLGAMVGSSGLMPTSGQKIKKTDLCKCLIFKDEQWSADHRLGVEARREAKEIAKQPPVNNPSTNGNAESPEKRPTRRCDEA